MLIIHRFHAGFYRRHLLLPQKTQPVHADFCFFCGLRIRTGCFTIYPVIKLKKAAPLLIILAGCLWGTMGLFVRRLSAMGLSSMPVVEMRVTLSALILLPVILLKDRSLLHLKPRNLWPLICSGIFSILFFYNCYFSTINLMDLSTAAILLYTAPIFVMLLSLLLFHERLTLRKVLALLLAFGGCCLVSGIGTGSMTVSAMGILLGLGSGLGYALYSIFSRFSLNQGMGSMTITFYTFLFASIGGIFLTDFSVYRTALQTYGVFFVLFAIFFTLVTTVLPYLLYTAGLSYVENGSASVMASVEPVVASILGIVVFSEVPTVSSVAGIVLVLLALCLLNLPGRKASKQA